MDVLGNNIANVNTNGFKKGRVTFQDMLSQTLSGAAKPTDEVGGVNPQQVGLGMMVSTIDTIHTQGVAAVHRRHDGRRHPGQRLLRPEGREQAVLHAQRRFRPGPERHAW